MSRRPFADIKTMNSLFPAAEAAALKMGESEPGAEHLILAAFDLPDGSAVRVFQRIGIEPSDFYDAITAQHEDALGVVGITAPEGALSDRIPSSARPRGLFRSKGSAQQLFQRVVALVKNEKSQLLGAYFVLAAAEMDAGTVFRALRQMGVDPDELQVAARREIDQANG